MNGIIAAALPVFGLLACLFLGFILLSSESRSGERFAYVFFGVGVAWLIASGTVLWPKVSHAGLASAAQVAQRDAAPVPAPAVTAARAAQPAPHWYGYPAPFVRQGFNPAYGYPYGYGQPYSYPQPNAYGYPYAYPYAYPGTYAYAYGQGYRQGAFHPYGFYR